MCQFWPVAGVSDDDVGGSAVEVDLLKKEWLETRRQCSCQIDPLYEMPSKGFLRWRQVSLFVEAQVLLALIKERAPNFLPRLRVQEAVSRSFCQRTMRGKGLESLTA